MDDAYFAGFFDGEGCIRIQSSHKGTSWHIRVTCVQRNPAPLLLMVERYGGAAGKFSKGRNEDMWTWYAMGPKAAAFLERVLPYLIVKREQAEMALAFQARRLPREKRYAKAHKTERDHQRVLDEADAVAITAMKHGVY
jgi:hypothetical protein